MIIDGLFYKRRGVKEYSHMIGFRNKVKAFEPLSRTYLVEHTFSYAFLLMDGIVVKAYAQERAVGPLLIYHQCLC